MFPCSSHGTCLICTTRVERTSIIAHSLECLRTSLCPESDTLSCIILVEGMYAKEYWMLILARHDATLSDLDHLIRDVWMEGRENQSTFTIKGAKFSSQSQTGAALSIPIRSVTTPDSTFSYEYDPSSKTKLAVSIVGESPTVPLEGTICLIARNERRKLPCQICRGEGAYLSTYWQGDPQLTIICGECAEKNAADLDPEYVSVYPNSPRYGIFGYRENPDAALHWYLPGWSVPDFYPQKADEALAALLTPEDAGRASGPGTDAADLHVSGDGDQSESPLAQPDEPADLLIHEDTELDRVAAESLAEPTDLFLSDNAEPDRISAEPLDEPTDLFLSDNAEPERISAEPLDEPTDLLLSDNAEPERISAEPLDEPTDLLYPGKKVSKRRSTKKRDTPPQRHHPLDAELEKISTSQPNEPVEPFDPVDDALKGEIAVFLIHETLEHGTNHGEWAAMVTNEFASTMCGSSRLSVPEWDPLTARSCLLTGLAKREEIIQDGAIGVVPVICRFLLHLEEAGHLSDAREILRVVLAAEPGFCALVGKHPKDGDLATRGVIDPDEHTVLADAGGITQPGGAPGSTTTQATTEAETRNAMVRQRCEEFCERFSTDTVRNCCTRLVTELAREIIKVVLVSEHGFCAQVAKHPKDGKLATREAIDPDQRTVLADTGGSTQPCGAPGSTTTQATSEAETRNAVVRQRCEEFCERFATDTVRDCCDRLITELACAQPVSPLLKGDPAHWSAIIVYIACQRENLIRRGRGGSLVVGEIADFFNISRQTLPMKVSTMKKYFSQATVVQESTPGNPEIPRGPGAVPADGQASSPAAHERFHR